MRAREPLIVQGDASDRAFVVYRGLFETIRREPAPRRLSWLGPGRWIGEIGVLSGAPRSASIVAWRDSVVIELDADVCRVALSSGRDSVAALTLHLLERGRRRIEPRPPPHVLGVIPMHDNPDAEAALRAAAQEHPEVTLIDGAGWREDDPASVVALESPERDALVHVWLGDPTPSPWTRAVVRSADRVALLFDVEHGLASSELERSLGLPDRARRVDVLALGSTAERSAVMALRPKEQVHVLRYDPTDFTDYLDLFAAEHAHPERLARFDLFSGLDAPALARVQEGIEWRSLAGGEQLIARGEPADGLYLLDMGRLSASEVDAEGERIILSDMVEGTTVGELAILLDRARTADVHAVRDSRVGFLPSAEFERLLQLVPNLGDNAAQIAATRASMPGRSRDSAPPSFLAVLGLESGPVFEDFVRRLEAALGGSMGLSVGVVRSESIDAELGAGFSSLHIDQPGYRRVLSWLDRFDAAHDVTLLVCHVGHPRWVELCMRQADRHVLVAPSTSDPWVRAVETQLTRRLPPLLMGRSPELVLLQPADIAEARGTSAWLEARPTARLHHVREGNAVDVAAAARRIMGCAVGLALSGGSSRAPAHLGVLRAMQELGLPVDIISGTSSGAGVAASLAIGMEHAPALELAISIVERLGIRPWELQPPYTAITSGRRFNQILQDACGARLLEDQLIPCSFSAVDIVRKELCWLDRGLMWHAVRASASLPIVFPPASIGGRLLIDGGLVSDNPVGGVMSRCERGLVVVSELSGSANSYLTDVPEYGVELSGWRQLADRVLPWRTPASLPDLETILSHSMTLPNFLARSGQVSAHGHPSVCVIRSKVDDYGRFEVDDSVARVLEQQAYEVALEQLRGWMEDPPHRVAVQAGSPGA